MLKIRIINLFLSMVHAAHGSTIRYNASISSQVAKLTIVNGDGDIQEINDPEELKAFKMHLGLLGKPGA